MADSSEGPVAEALIPEPKRDASATGTRAQTFTGSPPLEEFIHRGRLYTQYTPKLLVFYTYFEATHAVSAADTSSSGESSIFQVYVIDSWTESVKVSKS